MSIRHLSLTLGLATCVSSLAAQQDSSAPLSDSDIAATVNALAESLRRDYVFEDKAAEIATLLTKKLEDDRYDGMSDRRRLAEVLTRDIQSVNQDLHLRVQLNPPQPTGPRLSPEEMHRLRLESGQRRNFGFEKIEKLAGNVGYLDLRGFASPRYGGSTAVAAMTLLQYSDAIIIDLRNNGGGDPEMIQLISSYFFDEPTHLNSFFFRGQEQIDQFWTLPHVPGQKMIDTPLYLLTSRRTFSAAEEFTYNLKHLERATVVGQTTGGGAHPGGTRGLPNGLNVFIPRGRAINPITKTNWEGTGVKPHVETAVEDALDVAHAKALAVIAEKASDDPQRKRSLEWAAAALDAKTNPVALELAVKRSYAGSYGPRKITVDASGKLWYARDGRDPSELVALKDGLFMVDGIDYFRIRFVEDGGKVVALEGHYDDGRTDRSERQ